MVCIESMYMCYYIYGMYGVHVHVLLHLWYVLYTCTCYYIYGMHWVHVYELLHLHVLLHLWYVFSTCTWVTTFMVCNVCMYMLLHSWNVMYTCSCVSYIYGMYWVHVQLLLHLWYLLSCRWGHYRCHSQFHCPTNRLNITILTSLSTTIIIFISLRNHILDFFLQKSMHFVFLHIYIDNCLNTNAF